MSSFTTLNEYIEKVDNESSLRTSVKLVSNGQVVVNSSSKSTPRKPPTIVVSPLSESESTIFENSMQSQSPIFKTPAKIKKFHKHQEGVMEGVEMSEKDEEGEEIKEGVMEGVEMSEKDEEGEEIKEGLMEGVQMSEKDEEGLMEGVQMSEKDEEGVMERVQMGEKDQEIEEEEEESQELIELRSEFSNFVSELTKEMKKNIKSETIKFTELIRATERASQLQKNNDNTRGTTEAIKSFKKELENSEWESYFEKKFAEYEKQAKEFNKKKKNFSKNPPKRKRKQTDDESSVENQKSKKKLNETQETKISDNEKRPKKTASKKKLEPFQEEANFVYLEEILDEINIIEEKGHQFSDNLVKGALGHLLDVFTNDGKENVEMVDGLADKDSLIQVFFFSMPKTKNYGFHICFNLNQAIEKGSFSSSFNLTMIFQGLSLEQLKNDYGADVGRSWLFSNAIQKFDEAAQSIQKGSMVSMTTVSERQLGILFMCSFSFNDRDSLSFDIKGYSYFFSKVNIQKNVPIEQEFLNHFLYTVIASYFVTYKETYGVFYAKFLEFIRLYLNLMMNFELTYLLKVDVNHFMLGFQYFENMFFDYLQNEVSKLSVKRYDANLYEVYSEIHRGLKSVLEEHHESNKGELRKKIFVFLEEQALPKISKHLHGFFNHFFMCHQVEKLVSMTSEQAPYSIINKVMKMLMFIQLTEQNKTHFSRILTLVLLTISSRLYEHERKTYKNFDLFDYIIELNSPAARLSRASFTEEELSEIFGGEDLSQIPYFAKKAIQKGPQRMEYDDIPIAHYNSETKELYFDHLELLKAPIHAGLNTLVVENFSPLKNQDHTNLEDKDVDDGLEYLVDLVDFFEIPSAENLSKLDYQKYKTLLSIYIKNFIKEERSEDLNAILKFDLNDLEKHLNMNKPVCVKLNEHIYEIVYLKRGDPLYLDEIENIEDTTKDILLEHANRCIREDKAGLIDKQTFIIRSKHLTLLDYFNDPESVTWIADETEDQKKSGLLNVNYRLFDPHIEDEDEDLIERQSIGKLILQTVSEFGVEKGFGKISIEGFENKIKAHCPICVNLRALKFTDFDYTTQFWGCFPLSFIQAIKSRSYVNKFKKSIFKLSSLPLLKSIDYKFSETLYSSPITEIFRLNKSLTKSENNVLLYASDVSEDLELRYITPTKKFQEQEKKAFKLLEKNKDAFVILKKISGFTENISNILRKKFLNIDDGDSTLSTFDIFSKKDNIVKLKLFYDEKVFKIVYENVQPTQISELIYQAQVAFIIFEAGGSFEGIFEVVTQGEITGENGDKTYSITVNNFEKIKTLNLKPDIIFKLFFNPSSKVDMEFFHFDVLDIYNCDSHLEIESFFGDNERNPGLSLLTRKLADQLTGKRYYQPIGIQQYNDFLDIHGMRSITYQIEDIISQCYEHTEDETDHLPVSFKIETIFEDKSIKTKMFNYFQEKIAASTKIPANFDITQVNIPTPNDYLMFIYIYSRYIQLKNMRDKEPHHFDLYEHYFQKTTVELLSLPLNFKDYKPADVIKSVDFDFNFKEKDSELLREEEMVVDEAVNLDDNYKSSNLDRETFYFNYLYESYLKDPQQFLNNGNIYSDVIKNRKNSFLWAAKSKFYSTNSRYLSDMFKGATISTPAGDPMEVSEDDQLKTAQQKYNQLRYDVTENSISFHQGGEHDSEDEDFVEVPFDESEMQAKISELEKLKIYLDDNDNLEFHEEVSDIGTGKSEVFNLNSMKEFFEREEVKSLPANFQDALKYAIYEYSQTANVKKGIPFKKKEIQTFIEEAELPTQDPKKQEQVFLNLYVMIDAIKQYLRLLNFVKFAEIGELFNRFNVKHFQEKYKTQTQEIVYYDSEALKDYIQTFLEYYVENTKPKPESESEYRLESKPIYTVKLRTYDAYTAYFANQKVGYYIIPNPEGFNMLVEETMGGAYINEVLGEKEKKSLEKSLKEAKEALLSKQLKRKKENKKERKTRRAAEIQVYGSSEFGIDGLDVPDESSDESDEETIPQGTQKAQPKEKRRIAPEKVSGYVPTKSEPIRKQFKSIDFLKEGLDGLDGLDDEQVKNLEQQVQNPNPENTISESKDQTEPEPEPQPKGKGKGKAIPIPEVMRNSKPQPRPKGNVKSKSKPKGK